MDITLRMSDHALTARAAAAAGIVLLQNKNRTLPLLPQEDGAPLPVAVFGVKQLQTPAFDKTMTPWRSIGVLDGLAASETVRPDALLARKYRTWAVEHPEGSEMPLTNLDFGALRHDCAAAVVVIGRTPERYGLRLTDEETAMLTRVTSVFDRTVLVLAAPGFIELNEAALSCGAIVFLGLAGQEAGGALADVLTAKVMPSGHLSFSWPERAEAFADACAAADQFTGYRYFDSFGVPVRYPFGHGLSYGTVAFGSVSAGLDGCDVTVSAELVNTGEEFAASELVQVYVTRPEGDLTRPVSFLNCFRKSRLLAPGESQTITLRFPITELSVYRESAHAFVLDAGYYDIRIGTSSRACYLAGSIRLTRSAVVQAAEPLTMPAAQERRRPEAVCFQFPEDLAEIEQAHKHAIRFSDRDLPRRSRRRGREFTGCARTENTIRLPMCARAGAACSILWPIWTRKIWSGWSAASAERKRPSPARSVRRLRSNAMGFPPSRSRAARRDCDCCAIFPMRKPARSSGGSARPSSPRLRSWPARLTRRSSGLSDARWALKWRSSAFSSGWGRMRA